VNLPALGMNAMETYLKGIPGSSAIVAGSIFGATYGTKTVDFWLLDRYMKTKDSLTR
jgi:hypothetical protein